MSTQGVAPGGAVEGSNPRREPQVIDYYKGNVPYGTDFRYKAYWRGPVAPKPAHLTSPNAGTYQFSRGFNDILDLVINDSLIKTIEFGSSILTSQQVRDKMEQALGVDFVNVAVDTVGRIVLTTYEVGSSAKIRIASGSANTVFGYINETTVYGTSQTTGVSTSLEVNPAKDNFNSISHYLKRILFSFSEELDLTGLHIRIASKNITLSLCNNSHYSKTEQLLSQLDPESLTSQVVNGKKWYFGELIFDVPVRVSSAEADFLVLSLMSGKAIVTTGMLAGEMIITLKGWYVQSGLV